LEECPAVNEREQDPPQVLLVANVLAAVLGDFCARHQLAPNLVANNQDLRSLVRARVQGESFPEDSPLAQGWRQAHVLPHLLQVLEGRRTLRITDLSAEAPFEIFDS